MTTAEGEIVTIKSDYALTETLDSEVASITDTISTM